MTKVKVAQRNWSLDRFSKSVNAACRRQGRKAMPAAKLKKAYDDGLAVRAAVALVTPPTGQASK